MVPNPLHPAIVHFPIVFAILLPFVALFALWLLWRGRASRALWLAPLALSALLSVSALVALKTGQQEEDRVEKIVGENTLGAHEEAAEQFLVFSVVLLLVAGAGMLRGNGGKAARIVTTLGAFVIMLLGFRVGKAGGELVYKHGAAGAYAAGTAGAGQNTAPATNTGALQQEAAPATEAPARERGREHDDDD